MQTLRSLVDGKAYVLGRNPQICFKNKWYPAHLIATQHGTALVPNDGLLSDEAIVWVEYVA